MEKLKKLKIYSLINRKMLALLKLTGATTTIGAVAGAADNYMNPRQHKFIYPYIVDNLGTYGETTTITRHDAPTSILYGAAVGAMAGLLWGATACAMFIKPQNPFDIYWGPEWSRIDKSKTAMQPESIAK